MKKYLLLFVLILVSTAVAGLIEGQNVDVTLLSQEPDPTSPGDMVKLRFKVENLGMIANDVEFEIIPEYPFSLMPGDDGSRKIGTLYGRQQGDDAAILYFKMKVDENAVEGSHKLKLKYRTSTFGWTLLEDFDVRVQSDDPILSIESITSEPELIAPGKKAKISIKIKNQADSVVKNIRVQWTPLTITSGTTSITELPFTPIGSTNEKTIYMLKPGEEIDVGFNMIVSPSAESKDYKVQLTIDYSDELGTDYNIDNVMGLIVGNSPEITVGIEDSQIYQAKQQGEVSIRFINKDVMDIKFVNVQLEEKDCYEVLSPNLAYLGNIDSDDYETAIFNLYIKNSDCTELPVNIEYKDANNNAYEQSVKLELNLYNDEEAIMFGMKQKQSVIGPFIMLLIVGGGLFWYFKRKNKKKNAK